MSVSGWIAEGLARATALEAGVAAVVARVVAIIAILVALLIVYRIVQRVIDRILRQRDIATDRPRLVLPSRTLAPLLTSLVRWLLAFVGLVMVLREVGVDVQALLVSAGVLGLAVGLGAQSLIKDVITGFFLLFEGLLAVGDEIEVNAHRGTVESIGLRVTQVRLGDGALHIVPNGQLTEFTKFQGPGGRSGMIEAHAHDRADKEPRL